jgi:hypothetical protein
LTAAQVLESRSSKKTTSELAAEYGVCYETLWSARTRRTWKHL